MKRDVISLWLKLVLFAAVLLVPTVLAIATQFRQTVGFVADLGINQEVLSTMQLNIDILQGVKPHVSRTDAEQLENAIEKSGQTLDAYAAMFDLKDPLLGELYQQTAIFGAVALLVGLLLAWGLARNIVKIFRALSAVAIEKERQQATLRSLEDWQSVSKTVIHELRSSLTPIKLLSVRDRDTNMGVREEDAGDVIRIEIGKIENLIDELTNFARLPSPVKILADINETIGYAARNFEFENARLVFLPGPATILVPHDAGMIQRLLFNLTRNAVEANPDKVVEVTIGLETSAAFLNVHIRDDGKGIKAEQLSTIFQEGYSSKPRNLGIGLAISKKIALDHGGDLVARPAAYGAHFVLSLPFGVKQ